MNGNGKGSAPRPKSINGKEYGTAWDRTFGFGKTTAARRHTSRDCPELTQTVTADERRRGRRASGSGHEQASVGQRPPGAIESRDPQQARMTSAKDEYHLAKHGYTASEARGIKKLSREDLESIALTNIAEARKARVELIALAAEHKLLRLHIKEGAGSGRGRR